MINKIKKTVADIENGEIKPVLRCGDNLWGCFLMREKLPLDLALLFDVDHYAFSFDSIIGLGETPEEAYWNMIDNIRDGWAVGLSSRSYASARIKSKPSTVDYVKEQENKEPRPSLLALVIVAGLALGWLAAQLIGA